MVPVASIVASPEGAIGALHAVGIVFMLIEEERLLVKVTVKIFGRSTPVELNYMQVEKLT